MIEIYPGHKYFWKNGAAGIPAQFDELRNWADMNIGTDNYVKEGNTTNSIVFYFFRDEDATAFKLRFLL